MDLYQLKFPARKFLSPLLEKVRWIHPDAVSYAAVAAAAFTGWFYYRAADIHGLLIAAAALVLLRMGLNTLDGIMAIARGNMSLKGEIVNALPDRYSDLFFLIGITLSPLCRDWLGILALSTVVLVSYTGMLGKAIGVSWQHHGPLGKVERLILLMVFSVIQFFTMDSGGTVSWFGVTATPLEFLMGIYIVLGQITVLRRTRGQLREIDRKESVERLGAERNISRAVVVYESLGGNTKAVAENIAAGLGCRALHVADSPSLPAGCELLVVGTPNLRRNTSPRLAAFLDGLPEKPPKTAVFATFGLPLWGHATVRVCLGKLEKKLWSPPIGTFSCPGFHRKYKTYKGRPSGHDLQKAFSYGLRLSRKLDRAVK